MALKGFFQNQNNQIKMKAIEDLVGQSKERGYWWQKDAKRMIKSMATQLSQQFGKDVEVEPKTKTILHPWEMLIDDEAEPETKGEFTLG